ncbi:MAG: hypothetical protein IT332_02395 [Ardenticatenales bacterium]|nr:hypothetical protein [Ardenticatenales bacterium]
MSAPRRRGSSAVAESVAHLAPYLVLTVVAVFALGVARASGRMSLAITGTPNVAAAAGDTTIWLPAALKGRFLPAPASLTTSHPRLWLTAADLPRLRRWATDANPMYARGLAIAARDGRARADAHWSWTWRPGADGLPGTGLPDAGWQDTGGFQFERDYTEAHAQMFAFLSLVEPDPDVRDAYAGRARDMLMWIMNQAALGPEKGQPFRDPLFATYNRGNAMGMAIPLTVDWIHGRLSAQDKATIRTVFLRWIQDCETAYPTSRGPLTDGRIVNDLRLLGSSPDQSPHEQDAARRQLRWTANNYWLGHMRAVTLMTLSFDAADDPDGRLTSYARSITGHWLYAAYAMFEDRATVEAALGVPPGNPSIGLASGGLPVEGTLYGDSLGYLSQTLLALHTAGYDDPARSGPQIGLIRSAFWDRAVDGFLHTISPVARVPDASTGLSYLGPVYVPATYGDLLRDWVTWEGLMVFGPLAVLDHRTGNDARLGALRWILDEALEGGPAHRFDRAARIWGNGLTSDAILSFLVFDPAASPPVAPPPADPRPARPLTFVDRPYGRLLSRTDWGPDAAWLTFKCSWMSINHQNGDCNQFEFYRKGEWLTKERSGYADDMILMTSDYHNTLSLQNDKPANPNWFDTLTIERGGQWTQGAAAGDPTTTFSTGQGYVFAQGDGTNLYNRPPDAMTIRHASRSLVWIQPDRTIVGTSSPVVDTLVVYDRATSASPDRFKRFHLTLLALPVIDADARTAVETTPGGQQLVIQTLLPASATLTASLAETFNTVAQLEPSTARLIVEDPSNPSDVRFLHVLRAGDAGAARAAAATLVRTVEGTNDGVGGAATTYEGALVDNAAVLFPRVLGTTVDVVRYAVPATTTSHIVTGLVPGAGYGVAFENVGGERRVTVTAGDVVVADEAGVVRF